MKLFRAAQLFGTFLLVGVWAVRRHLHPDQADLEVLLIAASWTIASELGFHVGRSSRVL